MEVFVSPLEVGQRMSNLNTTNLTPLMLDLAPTCFWYKVHDLSLYANDHLKIYSCTCAICEYSKRSQTRSLNPMLLFLFFPGRGGADSFFGGFSYKLFTWCISTLRVLSATNSARWISQFVPYHARQYYHRRPRKQ